MQCSNEVELNQHASNLQNPISTGGFRLKNQLMVVWLYSAVTAEAMSDLLSGRKNGDLMVLGGNQSDAINIRSFSKERVTGYRWPVNVAKDSRELPLMTGSESVNES